MQLSKRLLAVADMVTPGNRLADVGCDHGYVPIYLIQQGKIPSAIAMDVRTGPLSRAKEHIKEQGLEKYIETRLSDGIESLEAGEADTLLIAGMGGGLVRKILEQGQALLPVFSELILQPQSEVRGVRAYLYENGYVIQKEDMVLEDGKYYPMMQAMKKEVVIPQEISFQQELYFKYGGCLLENQHPILLKFLQKEKHMYQEIEENLKKNQTLQTRKRLEEIIQEMQFLDAALTYYEV